MNQWSRLTIWNEQTLAAIEKLVTQSMVRGAEALTVLVGEPVQVSNLTVSRVLLSDLPRFLPDPEAKAVGVFLLSEGDVQGRYLLLLSHDEALALARLMSREEASTATELDRLARSALGEVGNQLSAVILNTVYESLHRLGRPSPPAVLEDMAGALVQLWLTAGGRLEDHLVIIDTTFSRARQSAKLHFLFMPEHATLRAIAREKTLNG